MVAYVLITGAGVAVGVLGSFLPVLPGLGLIWISTLAYALLTGPGGLAWSVLALSLGLAVGGTIAAVRIPVRSQASGRGLGVVLGVVGFFAVPVIGAPLGFASGIYLSRYRATRDATGAWRSTVTTLRALGKAALVQGLFGLAMALLWLVLVLAETFSG